MNDSDENFSWIEVFKNVIREPSSKSLITKKLLKSITKSIRNLPQFGEGDDITQDQTFSRAWASLSFTACMPQVGGERRIR